MLLAAGGSRAQARRGPQLRTVRSPHQERLLLITFRETTWIEDVARQETSMAPPCK